MPAIDRVVVPGHIGEYRRGQILLGRDVIAEYYRTVAKEAADEPDAVDKLTDDEVFACIEKIDTTGMDDEDIDVVRVEALDELLANK